MYHIFHCIEELRVEFDTAVAQDLNQTHVAQYRLALEKLEELKAILADPRTIEASAPVSSDASHEDRAAPKPVDDLFWIRGVDASSYEILTLAGFSSFADIASWSAKDIDVLVEAGIARAEVNQGNWIEQAAILAGGGVTQYARRFMRGEYACVVPTPAQALALTPVASCLSAPVLVLAPASLAGLEEETAEMREDEKVHEKVVIPIHAHAATMRRWLVWRSQVMRVAACLAVVTLMSSPVDTAAPERPIIAQSGDVYVEMP